MQKYERNCSLAIAEKLGLNVGDYLTGITKRTYTFGTIENNVLGVYLGSGLYRRIHTDNAVNDGDVSFFLCGLHDVAA